MTNLYMKCRIVRRYFGLPLESPDNNELVAEFPTLEEAAAHYEKVGYFGRLGGQTLHIQYATEDVEGNIYGWYDTDRSESMLLNADIESRRATEAEVL